MTPKDFGLLCEYAADWILRDREATTDSIARNFYKAHPDACRDLDNDELMDLVNDVLDIVRRLQLKGRR